MTDIRRWPKERWLLHARHMQMSRKNKQMLPAWPRGFGDAFIFDTERPDGSFSFAECEQDSLPTQLLPSWEDAADKFGLGEGWGVTPLLHQTQPSSPKKKKRTGAVVLFDTFTALPHQSDYDIHKRKSDQTSNKVSKRNRRSTFTENTNPEDD